MQLGIRTKFIGILLVAAVIPLGIGVVAVWVLGANHYRKEKGVLFESVAMHQAQDLGQVVNEQIEALDDWLALSDLSLRIDTYNKTLPPWTADEFSNRVEQIEARWPALQGADPELHGILHNELVEQIEAFRSLHPLFAEIFVTDIKGQVIAGSEKTSDYWQADEEWWRRGMEVGYHRVYAEGVDYDRSAKVYSIDISIPIRGVRHPEAAPVGVLKGVLNISSMFSSVKPLPFEGRERRQIVDVDGRLVYELDRGTLGSFKTNMGPLLVRRLAASQPGWAVERTADDELRLVGFAPVRLAGSLMDPSVPFAVRPLYVIVHDDPRLVLAPVRRQLVLLSVSGGLVVLVFVLAGLYVANRKIIAPIRQLSRAAQLIAASAKLADASTGQEDHSKPAAPQAAKSALDDVRRIRTADEIEDLAHDFVSMAVRVLRYHEQLEEEIATKTAEIQRDLQFAREFQEALMPHDYPLVPSASCVAPLTLNFHHVYLPASSVGGDFFDVLKLDDHRAGIFIADVMGHGARSALVTAILRTLLQDLSPEADDPAAFLGLINRHFYDLVQESRQFIFVSAFYLIIDTQNATATYASAGHPSPLLADRRQHAVRPLFQHLHDNPALGLFRDAQYSSQTNTVAEGDVFLLYTDGILEAADAHGEEFGRDRLGQTLRENLARDVVDLTQSVIDGLNRFTGGKTLPDDVCLVAVEVGPSTATAQRRRASDAKTAVSSSTSR